MSQSPSPQDLGQISAQDFGQILANYSAQLAIHEADINTLNVFPVPDSDTGTNSLLTVQAGIMGLDSHPIVSESLGEVVTSFAKYAGVNARGNSGTILAEFFRGLGDGLGPSAGVEQWHQALQDAHAFAKQAVLSPRTGTMLSITEAVAKVMPQHSLAEYLGDITHVAKRALLETTTQLEELRVAGVVDSGACVLVLFHAAVSSFYNHHVINIAFIDEHACVTVSKEYQGPAFEVTFLLTAGQEVRESLQIQLAKLGESLTIAGAIPVFKVHIHTDEVNAVLEAAGAFGEVSMVTTTELAEFISGQ